MPSWLDALINFLNSNNGTVTTIATIVIAIATVVLAIITWRYAKTTNEMLKASDRPEILIYLFPSEGYSRRINLCIHNIGTGFASDIEFGGDDLAFIPPLPLQRLPLKDLSIFKYGIDYLAPGRKIEIELFITHGMGDAARKTLEISVNYKDSRKKKQRKSFFLDLSKWVNFHQDETPAAKAAESLKKISSEIGSVLINLSHRR